MRVCVRAATRSGAHTVTLRAERVHVVAHDERRVRVPDVRGIQLHAQLAAVLLILPSRRRAHAFFRVLPPARTVGPLCFCGYIGARNVLGKSRYQWR